MRLSSNATENLIQGTKGKHFINSAPENGGYVKSW